MRLKDFTFLFALFALALFDALFGGALAALLQHEGWNQRVNDIWQVGFGTVCALALILLALKGWSRAFSSWLSSRTKFTNVEERLHDANRTLQDARWQAFYLLAMLLAYAEDLLFYPALWLFNDIGVTSLISGGYEYNFPRFLWPWSLSGWFGFVTRWIWGETIKLPMTWAMGLVTLTLAFIFGHIIYRKGKVA